MLESGEDIKFIARGIMICASEGRLGMLILRHLFLAVNASLAVERLGLPEARMILSRQPFMWHVPTEK